MTREPGRPAAVAVRNFRGEAAVVLNAGDYQAVFLPALGMLGSSLTWRDTELLSVHGGLAAYRRRSTTGLPLLAPWANRLSTTRFHVAATDVDLRRVELKLDDNGLPIHGTMTAQPGWEVVRSGVERDRACLKTRFDYGARPDLLAAYPFPHTIEIAASVGVDGLRVETAVTPTGSLPVPISFGWHPYFRAAGARDSWSLRAPARRHLELDRTGIPTGTSTRENAGDLRLSGIALDDLYALGRDRRFDLSGAGLTITVRFASGYPFAQLFAPPGQAFAAIEPMTAATDALVTGTCPIVPPGRRYRAAFTVSAARA